MESLSKYSEQVSLNGNAVLGRSGTEQFGAPDAKAAAAQPLPLSFAQQRLWFLEQLEPNTPLYNVPFALKLRGKLNTRALFDGIRHIVSRHEALRTNFGTQNTPVQWVRAAQEVPVSSFDLRRLDQAQQRAELQRSMELEARRPFDLGAGALMRAGLWTLAEEEHVLFFCLHHIVCDEWSLQLLLRELGELYNAFIEGGASPLPDLPIQYGDYTLWQRDWLQGAVLANKLAYWKKRLQDVPPRLNLGRERLLSGESHEGGREELELPQALCDQLRELSRRQGVTMYMTLLAAFKALLQRWTAQTDIAIGTPMSGRGRIETENLIGFFVNTLVLRTDLSGDPTFVELLQRVRETALEAYEHQDLPFEKLVEELHPQRSRSKVPLVNVVFAWEHPPEQACVLRGLQVELLDVDTGTSKFDLTWVVRELGTGIRLCVEYARAALDRPAVAALLAQWQTLLQSVVANPDQRISALPLASLVEKQRAIVDWNQTRREFPGDASLAALFGEQVRQAPDALAVRYGESQLTYDQLNRRSNRVANLLRRHGAGRDSLVALCVERGCDLIVGMLGIIKAGGAYVPIDPRYPQERQRFMLEDSQATILLTHQRWQGQLPSSKATVLCLDTMTEADETELLPQGSADDLAYVIYTSGSTGSPKGVLVPQRAVIRLVCGTDYVQLNPNECVAQASNACFDAATFEIWGALLNGSALVGLSRDTMLHPKQLAAELARNGITTLFVTTALFNQIASEAPEAFGSITHLLFGGEAVDPKWVARVLAHRPPKRLLHVYGPTEGTTFASWHWVQEVADDTRTIPIGRPIANTQLYVLDGAMAPVPAGVPGEIYVGGPGVARGYLNHPDLTRERFVPDPFGAEESERLYRTGDLARYRSDGSIEFLGRLDGQVKIRGYRVELTEVQAALNAHKSVRESAVVACDNDSTAGRRLVAYVVFHDGRKSGEMGELRQFLKERLPPYMLPSIWVHLDRLPLNPNGKVDVKALPPPETGRIETTEKFVSPRTEVERKLTQLWSQVLQVEPVGVKDDFFDLGGHSLLAVQLFGAIEKEFGTKLPLSALFQAPTVEQLAQLLHQEAEVAWNIFAEIQPEGSKAPLFWVHSLGGDGGGAFFYYRKLSQLLGPDQPSLGIRSPQEPFKSIERMAEFYVKELVKFQPQGPYYLGGFCFGGLVAFEMARQLRDCGKEVGLLVLLESVAPGMVKWEWSAKALWALCTNVQNWIGDLSTQNPEELLGRIRRKLTLVFKRIRERFSSAPASGPSRLGDLIDIAEYPKDYLHYAQAHWEALLQYQPKPYAGHITLFRAKKQPLFCVDPALGWEKLAREGVAVNVIPGTHEKMLQEPNVQILAAELRACLAEAQSGDEPEEDVEENEPDPVRGGLPHWSCSVIT